MNKTIKATYEEYRDEMAKLLALEEIAPQRFENLEFVEHFASKVDRLDTLIWLYADLLAARKN